MFTQERRVLRQLGAIVAGFDFRRGTCRRLEQEIAALPDCAERRALLAALFEERRREAQATLDLRDGAAYLTTLSASLERKTAE